MAERKITTATRSKRVILALTCFTVKSAMWPLALVMADLERVMNSFVLAISPLWVSKALTAALCASLSSTFLASAFCRSRKKERKKEAKQAKPPRQ